MQEQGRSESSQSGRSWLAAAWLGLVVAGMVAPARAAAGGPRGLPSVRLGVAPGRAPQVALASFDVGAALATDRARAARGERTRVGVARTVSIEAADGAWTDLPDGRSLWVAEVVSPEAHALRLHVADL